MMGSEATGRPGDVTPPAGLTPRQKQVVDIIAAYIEHNHEPPTVSFVARRLGVHKSTVQEHLDALCRKGWLETPRPFLIRRG